MEGQEPLKWIMRCRDIGKENREQVHIEIGEN